MTEVLVRRLTFEEFTDRHSHDYCELVDGQLEELVAPKPFHSWTTSQFLLAIGPYLNEREPSAFYGVELDIPTIPNFGRRPDFAYYAADSVTQRIDLTGNRVLAPPTLVLEVVSPDDEARDLVTKRREYAQAGIEHYWILDPQRRTALLLRLQDGEYTVVFQLSGGSVLTTPLFPGLEIPLSRLFRS